MSCTLARNYTCDFFSSIRRSSTMRHHRLNYSREGKSSGHFHAYDLSPRTRNGSPGVLNHRLAVRRFHSSFLFVASFGSVNFSSLVLINIPLYVCDKKEKKCLFERFFYFALKQSKGERKRLFVARECISFNSLRSCSR